MCPVVLFLSVWEFLNVTFNNLGRYVQEISLLYIGSKGFGLGSGTVLLAFMAPLVILDLFDFGQKFNEDYCGETWSLLNSGFSRVTDYELQQLQW